MRTPEVRVRRANGADRPAMLAISRTIWEGNDYVPSVWDLWLRDASGVVQVAEVDGEVAGFQHARQVPGNITWLEGIRVSEGHRRQGAGEALLRAGIRWAEDGGSTGVYLAVDEDNVASNRLTARNDLEVVARMAHLAAAEGHSAGGEGRLAQPFDLDEVCAFLHLPNMETTRLYMEGWTAYPLTRDRLRLLLAMKSVVVNGGSTIQALAIAITRSLDPSIRIGFLVGDPARVRSLVCWLRARTSAAGRGNVRGLCEVDAAVRAGLLDAGFSLGDRALLIRGRSLSLKGVAPHSPAGRERSH